MPASPQLAMAIPSAICRRPQCGQRPATATPRTAAPAVQPQDFDSPQAMPDPRGEANIQEPAAECAGLSAAVTAATLETISAPRRESRGAGRD